MHYRGSKQHMAEILELLADRLNKEEYATVTSAMSMLFVGHDFEMSEDGFEFINLAIESRSNAHENRIAKMKTKTLQSKVVRLKPKE
jgi:hypothetical protein